MKDKRSAGNATTSWSEERSPLDGGDLTGEEGRELSMKNRQDWLQFHSETFVNPSAPAAKFCTLGIGEVCPSKRKTPIICYLAKGQTECGQEALRTSGRHILHIPGLRQRFQGLPVCHVQLPKENNGHIKKQIQMSLPSGVTCFGKGYRFHFSGDGDRPQIAPKELETDLN